jgi:DNA-binding CsgD family transcriptional regulator
LTLGESVRQALIVAAADDSGELEVVEAAARRLGAGRAELARAENAGLLRLDGPRIEFTHPLVRAALYQGAAPSERRDAHGALAAALAGRDEPRRAWHAAAAAVGHDAIAAEALAAVAAESNARGAYAAAAAAFEQAAHLTPEGERRTVLLAHAAQAGWLAGQTGKAAELVAQGLATAASDRAHADVLALRGRIAMHNDEQDVAYDTLFEAAQLVEADDPGRAAELLAEAIGPAVHIGARAAARVADRLRALPVDTNPVRELDVAQALLRAASVAGDPEKERRTLVEVLAAAESAGVLDTSVLHVLVAARARFMLGDNDEAARLARRALERARQDGAMGLVVQALRLVAYADFDRGRWQTAYAAAGEAVELGHELEQRSSVCRCLGLLAEIDAARGDESACRERATAAIEIARSIGLSIHRERAERALGRLYLAGGNTGAAIEQLERVDTRLERAGNKEMNVTPAWDLVEAYARTGQIARARALLARAEVAMPPISPAEEVPIQRCHGILAEDGSFETAFERALVLDDEQPFPFERARTELTYGERLRRAGAPKRAREQLRAALAAFEELGATAWAERARSELAASGERLRRAPVAREALTPRELQVALAVAKGDSNAEVAAALYLTPKTVEYHLTHVYRKLGLRSRADLAHRFARGD